MTDDARVDGGLECAECSECERLALELQLTLEMLGAERQRTAGVLSLLADSVAIAQAMTAPPA